ncbi:hypothetical protein SDC9_117950 [bioreactor metagenome]|uniref:Indolepyruvate oxidoreductase subunit IorA n=1 Tax=bioreactor metagenome TaxID=1076179 RepID=A0A645C0Y9_9ZZZZ
MKMVGVNVAADPLFSFAYSGVNGGMVLITADDPGLHSSQNEQDNRHYAKFAKIAMLEPSDSQEAKDMIKAAMEISEKFNTPILFRMTTRVCHSKSLVEIGERKEDSKKPYTKNLSQYDLIPAVSKRLRAQLEERLGKLTAFAEETDLNYFEWNDSKIGIIASGVAYQYAKEVFGDKVSYFKLGFTYPLPAKKIKEFASRVETLYIIEELEPYLEEQIRQMGIDCIGKDKIPNMYELNPDIIAERLMGEEKSLIHYDKSLVANRPPVLCAGCPHRGFFYELSKKKNVMIAGDIGCYALGGADPLNAKDLCICMGAAPSIGHGAQKVFSKFNENMRVVATIGDSTFFHTGINSIMNIAYNNSNTITVILDNRITGMTGHQDHPGTGFTLQGMPTKALPIEAVVRALGIDHVRTVNPLRLTEVNEALDWAFALDEPSVIITRWPCVLKKHSPQDKAEFGNYRATCQIDNEQCIGCKMCINTGCPALRFDQDCEKAAIDPVQCSGCEVCLQVCPVEGIKKVGE